MKTLNRLALSFLLATLSVNAHADWREIEKFEDGMRVFVDPGSARRTGDTASVEHLVRWAEPQIEAGQPPYLSTKVLTHYDCQGKREKYVSSISYSGAMGNGPRVAIDDNGAESWYSVSESSLEEKLWKVACGFK